MNKWITGLIGIIIGFGGGFAAGYFARKNKEVQFEEVTEEELQKIAENDARDTEKQPWSNTKVDIPEPVEKKPSDTMKQIDTQKTQYWQKWNDGLSKEEYHRQSDIPEGEEVVITNESLDIPDDPDLEMDEEDDELREKPKVEISNRNEYNYWKSFKQGEYESLDLAWFSEDDVVASDDDDSFRIEDPIRYLGFQPKDLFKRDSDDVVYIKNNEFKVVYKIVRYDESFEDWQREEEYGGDDPE